MTESQANDSAVIPASAPNGANGASRHPTLPRVNHENAIVESLARVLSSPDSTKLHGLTRALNTFMGYITDVCGRRPDEMTVSDTTRLALILKAFDELEIEKGQKRHS